MNIYTTKISDHLMLNEVVCRCCGIGNVQPEIVSVFEEIRNRISKPLTITSSFRCLAHNRLVGGEENSTHCFGLAMDIALPYEVEYDYFYNICEEEVLKINGGCGKYPTKQFVHIDCLNSPQDRRWIG